MRRTIIQAALLLLVLAVTVPPLALLCRGRSPSRFETANLPVWERKPPRPAPQRITLHARPLPPELVHWDNAPWLQALRDVNENRLLAGMENPSPATAARADDAGRWLEASCALGHQNPSLAAKQDRVALRLMNTQDNDGYLAAGRGTQRWSLAQIAVFSHSLRGLLAYYSVSHKPGAVYAAMAAGDLVVATPALSRVPQGAVRAGTKVDYSSLTLPMARLYLLTGEARYRQWALRAAAHGQADGPGLCALYVATAQHAWLQQAQKRWKVQSSKGIQNPDFASALLAVTGAPGYAKMVRQGPAPWPCPLAPGTMAWTRSGACLAANVWGNGHVRYRVVLLTQRVSRSKPPNHAQQCMLTVTCSQPSKFTLGLPALAPGTVVAVNTKPQAVRPGQIMVVFNRWWKNGDQVHWLSDTGNTVRRPALKGQLPLPLQVQAHPAPGKAHH